MFYNITNTITLMFAIILQTLLITKVFTPVSLVVVATIILLFFRKLTYNDFRIKTKFSQLAIFCLCLSFFYNYWKFQYVSLGHSISIILLILLSISIAFNNPTVQWQLFNNRVKIMNFTTSFLKLIYLGVYILGGSGIVFMGMIAFGFIHRLDKNILMMFTSTLSELMILIGSCGFFIGISIIASMLLKRPFEDMMLVQSDNFATKLIAQFDEVQSKIFKPLVYIAALYLVLLPISALFNGIISAYYALPITILSILFLKLLLKEKLSFDETIYIKNRTEKFFALFFIIALAGFSLTKNTYNQPYSSAIWTDNLLYFQFNDYFFITYSLLVAGVTAFLLPLNNVRNSIEFFNISAQKLGRSFVVLSIGVLILFFVYWLLLFSNNPEKVVNNYFYFSLILLFSFALIAIFSRFLNYVIYRIVLTFKKENIV